MKETQEGIQTLNNIQSARQSHTSPGMERVLVFPFHLVEASLAKVHRGPTVGMEGTEKDRAKTLAGVKPPATRKLG